MSGHPDPGLEAMAAALEASGDYRVLRRYRAPEPAPLEEDQSAILGLVLDVETTGFDPASERIIQLALVPFHYRRDTGQITAAGTPAIWFEDPGRAIPPEIVKLTGITDEMVAGRRIDEPAVETLVASAGLVIAHNAAFDRPFAERRLPVFRDRPWACSIQDIPWRGMGLGGSGLEYLLMKHSRVFHAGHRADEDCLALLHLLTTPFPTGETPFSLLLASARKKSFRIWAIGSPIGRKDELKRRGYRFNNGKDGRPLAWYRDVSASEEPAERAWLAGAMYEGDASRFRVDALDARTRYSDRSA